MQNNTLYYNIGGRVMRVHAPLFRESPHLSVFRCEKSEADEKFDISYSDCITLPESTVLYSDGFLTTYADGSRTMKDEVGGGILFKDNVDGDVHTVSFLSERKEAFGNMMLLHILDLPGMFLDNGGLFLHASFIEYDGSAILFTADKQVGKSTQAALWEKYKKATVVNGDRALIIKGENGFNAFGSPYCGTSDICLNADAPVRAIVILSQSPVNSLRRASNREAVCAMLSGASYNPSDVRRLNLIADTVDEIVRTVPVYCLACTPDSGAVEALEAIL